MITLTPEAVKEVKRMMQTQPSEIADLGLRVMVKGGGCSGFSYALNFDKKHEGDNEFDFEGLKVFVDAKSYLYVNGITMDYADSLQGKGFRFSNPNATKSCGCGESFSV